MGLFSPGMYPWQPDLVLQVPVHSQTVLPAKSTLVDPFRDGVESDTAGKKLGGK